MQKLNNLTVRPGLYWVVLIVWLVVILLATIYGTNGFGLGASDNLSAAQQVTLAVSLLWVAMSIRIIKFNRTIGLLGLEMPISNVGPGPKVVPWLLVRILDYPADIQQQQFPGNPEEVFKGDDKDPIPPGGVVKYRPLRLTTGKPADGAKGILEIQATVEVLFYLRIQIVGALEFHLKYGDIDGFWRQMRDTGQKTLTEKFSQCQGLGELIAKLPQIMEALQTEYNNDAHEGGVIVVESGLDSPDLSKKLAEALRDLGVARSVAEQARVKLTEEGKGRAAAERYLIEETAQALENAGDTAKAAYVGARVLGDKTTILGTEGIAQAIGILQHLKKP
jgi:hypothetical protein